jgi:hypothetical protein
VHGVEHLGEGTMPSGPGTAPPLPGPFSCSRVIASQMTGAVRVAGRDDIPSAPERCSASTD